DFIKEFVKTKPEKAKEIREKLEKLDMLKLKPRHITKIIDFMPEDAEDLNKIISDASLNQEETNKILQAIK
ncbi:MAG: RNA polymerase Rpb4 family protein, partial [Candidatus Nanoarchaeia archaeon]